MNQDISTDEWFVLENYQGHEINTQGQIRNRSTGRILKTSVNQTGVRYVSIRNTTLRKYENRSLGALVSEAFLNEPVDESSQTVLFKDGDPNNTSASNIKMASRWEAIAYHKEIKEERWFVPRSIRDNHGRRYRSVAEAAMTHGLLPSSIEYAIRYNTSLSENSPMQVVHRVGGIVFKTR